MVVYRREHRRRSILVAAVFCSLVLITLDTQGSGFVGFLRDAGRDVAAPLQDAVDTIVDPVVDWADGAVNGGALRDENALLRKRLAEARGRLFGLRAERQQLDELERLLDLPTIEDATGIPARVVGQAPGNFERTLQIDHGSSSGVRLGMPVVSGTGLVGKVTQVSASRATVTLVDSPDLGVGVRLERSRVQGITEGRSGFSQLSLGFLEDPRADIQVGELVFTSGIQDAAFPPDIAVARVVRVSQNRRGRLDPDVRLEPVADIDNLEFVKVLRYTPPASG